MSIIAKINSKPLFTNKAEALKWGKSNGLSGYHKRTHFGKIGYMAGRTHSEIAKMNNFVTKKSVDMSTIVNQQSPTVQESTDSLTFQVDREMTSDSYNGGSVRTRRLGGGNSSQRSGGGSGY
jgi:hypothetical protein